MNKIIFVLFLFSFCLLNAQTTLRPTVKSEILKNYLSNPYFKLKKGQASKILALDTIYNDTGKNVEMVVFSFNEVNNFSFKKYRNEGLSEYKTMEVDSLGRVVSYTDSLSSGSITTKGETKSYVTRIRHTYKEKTKIIEQLDGLGETITRYVVKYDSLANPLIITETFVPENLVTNLQTIDYDYTNGTFLHSTYEYMSDEPIKNMGVIDLNFIKEKNKEGDIIKMCWPISKYEDGLVSEINYTYDEFGNWIKMFVTKLNSDGHRRIISKTYRKIKYRD